MSRVSEPFTIVEHGSLRSVYESYESSYSGKSFDLDVQLRGFLRRQHPFHVLTVVPEANVGLLHYAAAGKAYAKLDIESEQALRFRGYIRDAQPGTGRMAESIRFARYNYRAMDQDFIFYYVQLGLYMYQYILKEVAEGELTSGTSKLTDALLAAIGEFQRPEPLGDDIVYVYDGYWSASKDLFKQVKRASWDDVILDKNTKKALTEIVKKFFDSKDVYDDLGVPWRRGIILRIKALMHTLRDRKIPIPSLYVKSAATTWNIRQVFEFARQMAPCMLILEDIDTIVTPNTRAYFFNEVDGLENNDGILMTASTNYLDQLDPGLSKRPSRFDRKYYFPIPTQDERVKYCMYWRERILKKGNELSFPKKLCDPMAKKMEDFSFAYMKEAFVATLLAIAGNKSDGGGGDGDKNGDDDLDQYEMWREFVIQVKILREDMKSRLDGEERLFGPGGTTSTSTAGSVANYPIQNFTTAWRSQASRGPNIQCLRDSNGQQSGLPNFDLEDVESRLGENAPVIAPPNSHSQKYWKDGVFTNSQ